MSMLFSVWTVLVCALFAGIAWWAYGHARKGEFEDAARIPFDEDADVEHSKGDR